MIPKRAKCPRRRPIRRATRLALIEKTLVGAGFAMRDVVRATYYFTDARYWDEVGPVLGAAFGDIRPAATALIVGLVKPEMKVEIEVTAKKAS